MKIKFFLIVVLLFGAHNLLGSGQGDRHRDGLESESLDTLDPLTPSIPEMNPSNDERRERLRVYAGTSIVVSSPEPLIRVSVTDPAIASATIITPNQVLVHGHVPGAVSLIFWDEGERMRSFDLRVELDLSSLRATLEQVLPGESIETKPSRASIILTGKVSSQEVADQAVALAQTHAESVVSLLVEVGDQVLLQVRFAEVDRAAIQEFGVSLLSTGAGNTHGVISTQQFLQTLGSFGAIPSDVQRGGDPDAPSLVSGSKSTSLDKSPAVVGLSDLLNVFLFRPDINLGVAIRALQQRNLLEILAEPNLLARNGRPASFLAGGEFPFPTVQGVSGGLPAVTIQFREFGIRLEFTPTIMADGMIGLKIVQEVSALDYANALTVSGFVVPALSTRRTETELLLRDGQSFAIAGLVDNRLTEVVSKIPGLGDIPILGALFTSRSMQRNNTELLVMVTPLIVKPLEPGEASLPLTFPKPFLQPDDFDSASEKKPTETEPEKR